jgi:HAD superfamily hydrolase (TIGR01490 family)
MSGIDFFDVDHTLTRRSSGGRYITLAMRKGVVPAHLFLLLPWYAVTYRLGIFNMQEYEAGFPYLRGIRRDALEEIARESFDKTLKDDIFPETESRVRELLAGGRSVMLATSSIDLIVAPLADYLGVKGILATALEFKDGACTGRLDGMPMFRGTKKTRVLAFIAEHGVQPADCSFYSDSIYDLPLLESVGHPVAVNPDWRLRRVARERGWPVMEGKARPGRGSGGGRR